MSRNIEQFDVPVLMLLGNDWEARLTVQFTETGVEVIGVELGAAYTGTGMVRFARAAEVNLATLTQAERDHLDAVVRENYDGDV